MIIIAHQWNKYIACKAQYYTVQMQTLLHHIDEAMKTPEKVLKNDPTSTVVVVKVDNELLVVKRSNTKGIGHFLRRSFARSRARKNWDNAHQLHDIGVNTFSPIALLEERWGPFKKRSYFICSYIEGIAALHYFGCGAKPQPNWGAVAQEIANMLKRLAEHWISHRDLNLSNIIVVDNKPWLIDLDGMRQHRWYFCARQGARREQQRFMKNWDETPEVSSEVLPLFQTVFSTR